MKDGCMTSVLLQEQRAKMRPFAYFLAKLDPSVVGFLRCLHAVAAAEKAAMVSSGIVSYSDLTLLAPHISQSFCTNKKPPISPQLAGLKCFFSRHAQCHR